MGGAQVTKQEAIMIAAKQMPEAEIQAVIEYGDLFIFKMDTKDPFEAGFDPFYSVDKRTSAFEGFSIFGADNPAQITALFRAEQGG